MMISKFFRCADCGRLGLPNPLEVGLALWRHHAMVMVCQACKRRRKLRSALLLVAGMGGTVTYLRLKHGIKMPSLPETCEEGHRSRQNARKEGR